MEQTVTAKIQIKPDSQARQMLDRAMSVYKDACNFVAGYVFETHQLKQIPLQKAVYDDLRDKFGLKSQMACNVPRTVIAKFKSNKSNTGEWIKPDFKKPFLALSFNRDFSILANDVFSIGTLDGRIKVPFSRKFSSSWNCLTIRSRRRFVYRFPDGSTVSYHTLSDTIRCSFIEVS